MALETKAFAVEDALLSKIQGIAALAYGTESVEPVQFIVGPGSPWVVMAKAMVFGVVGIESLPGPSESLIIADDAQDPEWVAADLLRRAPAIARLSQEVFAMLSQPTNGPALANEILTP